MFVKLDFKTIEDHEQATTRLPSGSYLVFNGDPNWKDVYLLMTESDYQELYEDCLNDLPHSKEPRQLV